MKYYLRLSVIIFTIGCGSSMDQDSQEINIKNGKGWVHIHREDVTIPLRVHIQDNNITFLNALERIEVENLRKPEDSIIFEMPIYGSIFKGKILDKTSFKGQWLKVHSGPNYQLPFSAFLGKDEYEIVTDLPKEKTRYQVVFGTAPDLSNGVAEFYQTGSTLTGTFLTETGDYRYLQGTQMNDTFWLSTFDGAHLFYFEGMRTIDTLKGTFFSGKTWKEPFAGTRNDSAQLTHPDSLTTSSESEISFTVTKLDGQQKSFDSSDFYGKVTIIQIMGTWCPNCLDETKYYKELYEKYHPKGLEIISIGFERGTDKMKRIEYLKHYQTSLELPYSLYLGGEADKSKASQVFNSLSDITSFPTTIFLGEDGNIRKIHTGFYGPATGEWYDNYKRETEKFIEKLLTE